MKKPLVGGLRFCLIMFHVGDPRSTNYGEPLTWS